MISMLVLILATLAIAPTARPQAAPEAAPSVSVEKYLREVIIDFDFEESHPESTPAGWKRVTGPGYPAYTRGRFVTDLYRSKFTSFGMVLDGGNCAYEFNPKRIQVEPAYDYCLEGWIRTENLKASRARLGVWFTDQQGRKVEGSQVYTRDLAGTVDWTRVQVHISPLADAAGRALDQRPRYIVLSMEAVGREAQDIGAKVWFDDLRLFRIPRLAMTLAGGRMLYLQGEPVVVELGADGLLASSFPGRLTVRDDRGRVVQTMDVPLVPSGSGEARQSATLRPLAPGAYHVDYSLPDDISRVLGRKVSLAVFAPPSGPAYLRGNGFGVADITGIDETDRLVDVLTHLMARTVKVPLWNATTQAADLAQSNAELEAVLNKLHLRGVSFVGVFAEPPEYLRRQVSDEVRGLADLLALKEELWRTPLSYTVSRYAGIVSAWQIGRDKDLSLTRLQTEPKVLESATKQIDLLTAGTPLGVPWPALYAWPTALPPRVDFLALRIGPEILPEQINEYVLGQASAGGPRVYLTIEPIARSTHDPDERLSDFVSRVLAAKQAGVAEVFFSELVHPESGLLRAADEPTELLVVAHTLSDVLGGARFAGSMPMENGSTAMVFERDDGSELLCLWNELGGRGIREPLLLGQHLTQIDLWGNRRPVPQVESVASVDLTAMPVFITDIDPQISRTRRSFRFQSDGIPAAYRRHQTAVEFTNGFCRGISGYIELRAPQGWNIDPTVIRFDLAEGEKLVQPLVVTVPYNETVGEKEFVAEFHIDAKTAYRFAAVARTHFDMPTGRTRASAFREDHVLVIEQEVTNTTQRPMSYHAYVQIPGMAMINQFVPHVKPGETVVKRYELPYSRELERKTALIGIRDDTPDRGFANLLLPLGSRHGSAPLRTGSSGESASPR
jgi:hypothetical protein